MFTEAAKATYHRDLGDGLIERWSTAADTEKLAHLMGIAWRTEENDPPNPRIMDSMRRDMREDFPPMGPGDCALVEDTQNAGHPIVACACLWHEEWAYDGIHFRIGRPESIATHPDYRGRGLIRALMNMIHARSQAQGHLVQVISGIPFFYRQFGYEYALDFGGKRVASLALIPELDQPGPETYTLRAATTGDIPRIMELYEHRRATSLVSAIAPERYWQYMIERWNDPSALGKDPTELGMNSRIFVVVDVYGMAQGYAVVAAKRWGRELFVYALEFAPDINLLAVVPPFLRALQAYGLQVPAVKPSIEPLREISFLLGRTHPVYEALGHMLAPFHEPPYAWYVRVPDVPAFVRHIAAALEARLADSVVAGFTGDLKLDFYRAGLHINFDQGHLTQVEPWRALHYNADTDGRCPPLVFLQLLFGYRSLDELRYAFPDVWASHKAEVLLNALFPAKPSWVMQL